ncbi:hypothetical protein HDU98_004606 [Podochytrium sp. JEL0797]|nr:hypothetical protein HDU98_004606 [Podochytrium sp. JEL0797]
MDAAGPAEVVSAILPISPFITSCSFFNRVLSSVTKYSSLISLILASRSSTSFTGLTRGSIEGRRYTPDDADVTESNDTFLGLSNSNGLADTELTGDAHMSFSERNELELGVDETEAELGDSLAVGKKGGEGGSGWWWSGKPNSVSWIVSRLSRDIWIASTHSRMTLSSA